MDTPLDELSEPPSNPDIKEVQALNEAGKQAFATRNLELALDKANQSLTLLIQVTDTNQYPLLVENYLLQSNIFYHKKDWSQAANFAERAIHICREYTLPLMEIKAHLLIGKASKQTQQYELAMTHLLYAKELGKQNNAHKEVSAALLYIGILYNQVYHYSKALTQLRMLEEKYVDFLTPTHQLLLLNSLGKAYIRSSQIEQALHYFLEAERNAKKRNNKTALVYSLSYLGVIFSRKNEYNKALRYAKRVNNIREQIGDVEGIQVNLINLGYIHHQLEKNNESIKLTSRGIAAAKRMKDGLSEIRGYQIMAEIFRKQKDFKNAVMYQMIYTKFYEDFYQRNERQKLAEIEHQFIVKKLEEKIASLSKK